MYARMHAHTTHARTYRSDRWFSSEGCSRTEIENEKLDVGYAAIEMAKNHGCVLR